MVRTRELDHELRVIDDGTFTIGTCGCGGHTSTRRDPERVVLDWRDHLHEIGKRRGERD